MKEKDNQVLRVLAKQYPSIAAASTEIINLQSIMNLPKGTEHFLTDIADPDDCADDFVVVRLFVVDLLLLRDQLLDDIGEVLWQGLSHLGAGILGGHMTWRGWEPPAAIWPASPM